jgi:flagellar motor switch protein FliG
MSERGNQPAQGTKTLDGAQRAAIFLLSLGEKEAAEVLRYMGPKEVQEVGAAMANMKNIPKLTVNQVFQTFTTEVTQQTALGIGSDDYIRNVLTRALGEDKAGGVIDRVLQGRNSRGLDALKWMDARSVAETIRQEHPQIIAIVLSYLEPDNAAQVLAHLPDDVRPDVLMRVSVLEGIHPNALSELDEILEKQFAGRSNVESSHVGGIKIAANILNHVDTALEGEIMEKIGEADEELSQQIQDLMFVFDNLVEVDDRGIQALLREVSSDSLVTALKGADDKVKDKLFGNMSKRAAETLRDDLEVKGPVRLSDVEAAQKEILMVARRMAEAGDIVLGGKGGDEYV